MTGAEKDVIKSTEVVYPFTARIYLEIALYLRRRCCTVVTICGDQLEMTIW